MSPPMGNSSANEERTRVAKYISDVDSPTPFSLANQHINHDVDQRFRMRNATEEIPFATKENKYLFFPEETAEEIDCDENEYVFQSNQSKVGSIPSLENALPHTEPLNTGLLLGHQTTSPQYACGYKLKTVAGGTRTGKTTCNNGCGKECIAPGPVNTGSPVSSLRGGRAGGGGGGAGDGNEDQQAENKHPEQNAAKGKILSAFQWHTKINHYNFCERENGSCDNCKLVAEKIKEYLDDGNLDWAPVVGYHRKVCQFQNKCEICARLRQEELAAKWKKDRSHYLDPEDLIIWKNDNLGDFEETHFREEEHFRFSKPYSFVAKGGFGEVHNIELLSYFGSSCPCLVVKKAIVEDDEIYVLKNANHPNIVKTFLLVQKKDRDFTHRIFMEKCDKSMEDYLQELNKKNKSMDIHEAVLYWKQVVDAIAHLHFLNAIHKDIKPANILLSDNMVCAKLADFGLCEQLCVFDGYTGPDNSGTGPLGCIAPEILDEKRHGRPADIYSLAMLLLQMLGKSEANELKSLDEELGALIERCLNDDPKERPTAVQIQQAMQLILK